MNTQVSLLSSLNAQQQQAVGAPRSNMLIVAGAGTGKTRVLVSRIAWLLGVEAIDARQILAVTFTNKAAQEMLTRIEGLNLATVNLKGLWCGTFHSICARFLRSYAAQAGLNPSFTIMDTDDQKRLIDDLLKQTEQASLWAKVKELKLTPAKLAAIISSFKEAGLRAEAAAAHYAERCGEETALALELYPLYEKACLIQNKVDFGELILRCVELFEQNAPLRELQQRRFSEILVDEFQDTNQLQYKLITLLKGPHSHVFAVGDDDQSIYGWRGADYQNLKRFLADFAPVSVFKLEQNYRSSSQILAAANALISHNHQRLTDKHLVSTKGAGDRIQVLSFTEPQDEAIGIARRIERLIEAGTKPSDIAVLYRNNARSALIEQELLQRNIPYYVYGGQRFYERKEVQDAVSYLRLAVNPGDDGALLRIINVPPRGFGPAKLSKLRQVAAERGISLMQALTLVIDFVATHDEAPRDLKLLAKKAAVFANFMAGLTQQMKEGALPEALLSQVLSQGGLLDYYTQVDAKEEKSAEGGRKANLEMLLINAKNLSAREAVQPTLDLNGKPFGPVIAFLSNAALMGSTELNAQGENGDDVVQKVRLYTIHSAKGLEFNTVFVAGFERGLLPYTAFRPRSEREGKRQVEEERRLAYVAITRAKEHLYLCYAERGFSYYLGWQTAGPSPFLHDMVTTLGRTESKDLFNMLV
ncbi:MAG: UvrD-helicase domain-containing protein [Candidatus Anaerobiospirillum merdipullorum]|uniref:DNA 3'-5' helicase n=1 Tax=Candidatus Anaerobiospirillum merdipullorum TaxID=2838450 RepID=A0A9E2KMQ8_9GAMM|nr:UvrD-helicase domain-containing protein [Candidatus Anaerobiospirillum merdipullorum]